MQGVRRDLVQEYLSIEHQAPFQTHVLQLSHCLKADVTQYIHFEYPRYEIDMSTVSTMDRKLLRRMSWRLPGLEKFQGMQQWSTKPEVACNCYPSRSPHLMDGIRTLIVPCAQWQQQLPLVECPLSALLSAFCSSDTRHYSWRTMLFASCQV